MLSVRFRTLTAQKVLLRKPPAPDKFYVHVLIAISHSRERLRGHPPLTVSVAVGSKPSCCIEYSTLAVSARRLPIVLLKLVI